MRAHFILLALVVTGLIAQPSFADSNATVNEVVTSETVSVGAGPFDHGAAVGSADNTTTTATFTGGFTADRVRFTRTITSAIDGTFAIEASISITPPGGGTPFVFEGPAIGPYTTIDLDDRQNITFTIPGGIDPSGTWTIEFIDTFEDGPGADSTSTNVEMTFEETVVIDPADVDPSVVNFVDDEFGVFTFDPINPGDQVSTVGEFAVPFLVDTYAFTLTADQTLVIVTESDPDGVTGADADTEIAIYDAGGILIDTNDDLDINVSLFSGLTLDLTAGDYTIVVGTFDTDFMDGPSALLGAGTGDYALRINPADFILGDVNQDGAVNFGDIAAFIAALSSGSDQVEADINQDGDVNFADISGFIALLANS